MNSYDQHWCINRFNDLIKMPIARPFLRPVDPVADGAPDYLTVIQEPMDFSSVSKKLRSKEYNSPTDFINDLKLIVSNAIQYNGSDSMLAHFAQDLQKHFLWKFSCKSKSTAEEWFRDLVQAVRDFEELTRSCPLK
jgi:transcription initiation factor TFIID subunit 2